MIWEFVFFLFGLCFAKDKVDTPQNIFYSTNFIASAVATRRANYDHKKEMFIKTCQKKMLNGRGTKKTFYAF